jgi:hypothetical protein
LQVDWTTLLVIALGFPAAAATLAHLFRVKRPHLIMLPAIALIQLCLLSFAYFPYAVDQDVWGHAMFANYLASTHNLLTSFVDFAFPGFYIAGANISVVTGLPLPLSFEVPFAIIAVLLPFVIFEIIQRFSQNTTISYLVAGVAITTNLGLVPGMYGPLASTFSLFLILLATLLVIQRSDGSSGVPIFLVLFILAITLTDPLYSALVALFFASLFFFGKMARGGFTMDTRLMLMSVLAPVAFDNFNAHFVINQSLERTILSSRTITSFFEGSPALSPSAGFPNLIVALDVLALELSKVVYYALGGLCVLFVLGTLVFRHRLQIRSRSSEFLTVLAASVLSSSYFIVSNSIFEGGYAGRFQELSYPFIVLGGIEFFRLMPKSVVGRMSRLGRIKPATGLLVVGLLLSGLCAVYFVPRNSAYVPRSINEQQFEAGTFVSNYIHGPAKFSYDGYFLVAYMYVSNNPSPAFGTDYWIGDFSVQGSMSSCYHRSYNLIYSNGWVVICNSH